MRKMSQKAWDEVKDSSNRKYLLDIGTYVCAIKDYKDFENDEYVAFNYDVVEGDNAGFFSKMFKEDEEKYKDKAFWKGSFTRSYNEKSEAYWKAFVTSVEKSNKKFIWNPENPDLNVFKNKYIGLVIGQKEYIGNNGKVYKKNYIDSVHSVERIKSGGIELPELKKVEVTKGTTKNDNFVDPFGSNNENDDTDTNVVSNDDVGDAPFDDDDNPFANLD